MATINSHWRQSTWEQVGLETHYQCCMPGEGTCVGQDGLQSPQLFRQENEQANFIIVSSIPWAGWVPKYDPGVFF